MTTTYATGFGDAVGVFSMSPEFPVQETRARLGVQSPVEAGMYLRRQTMLSVSEVSKSDEVREWRLRWNIASEQEAAELRTWYEEARGSARLLLYYPPEETALSNLCPEGEKFNSPVWIYATEDTAVAIDGTALPAGVNGSAWLLTNASGATEVAGIFAKAGTYPGRPQLIAWSLYIQRPSTDPAGFMSIKMRSPDTGNIQIAQFAWSGSAWFEEAVTLGTSTVITTSGAWTRITLLTFSEIPGIGFFPDKRFIDIEVGKATAVEAGKGLLIAGGMIEQVPSISEASGGYTSERRHVLVRIVDAPLSIERHGPRLYRMQVTLREVPVAP